MKSWLLFSDGSRILLIGRYYWLTITHLDVEHLDDVDWSVLLAHDRTVLPVDLHVGAHQVAPVVRSCNRNTDEM